MEVGEDGVYPDHPEHTGTHDDDDSGNHGLAQTAGSGDGAVHKGGNAVGQRHDTHTLHTGINDGALGGEKGEELPPEQEQAAAQRQTHAKGIGQRDEVAFLDTVGLACTVVLAHKAGTGHVEGSHAVVDERISVCGGAVALDHEGIKGVDTGLDEQVGDGENGVLESGRQAQRQNAFGHGGIELCFLEMKGVAVLHPGQGVEDEPGRNTLGNGTGQRHACHVQVADDDKKQIQKDIQHTGKAQDVQRLFGLTDGAEHGVAEIVQSHCRHT